MASAPAAARMTRDEYKRRKELEEARKAGTAPAEVDEEGRDINPHIPQYISKTPWYYKAEGPTLKHQRVLQEEKFESVPIAATNIAHGVTSQTATRFRKGACENCGAMTHKKSECVERPRRLGAKLTGKDIAPDEVVPEKVKFNFESKRDRWNNYDVTEYKAVVEEHEKIEAEKRRQKLAEINATGKMKKTNEGEEEDDEDSSAEENEQEDEKGYADKTDMPGTKFDAKARFTVRNLRIREDTAKYLYNLDVNSAFYDPKTRTMHSNPLPEEKDSIKSFKGDNFVRYTGEVPEIAQRQLFAWEAADRGADVHLQAEPTKLELMHKTFAVKKDEFKSKQSQSILDKYGGQEHLEAPPKELLLAQSESYVEYAKTGRVVKGQEKKSVQSKYEEDVHPYNHSAVWGSYWRGGRWGYACCHSLLRSSYCVGAAGKASGETSQSADLTSFSERAAERQEEQEKKEKEEEEEEEEGARHDTKGGKGGEEEERRRGEERKSKKKDKRKESEGQDEDEEAARQQRLQQIMARQAREEKEAEELLQMDERRRPYNSHKRDHVESTEEEMEAYRMKRLRDLDPMAAYLGKDDDS